MIFEFATFCYLWHFEGNKGKEFRSFSRPRVRTLPLRHQARDKTKRLKSAWSYSASEAGNNKSSKKNAESSERPEIPAFE